MLRRIAQRLTPGRTAAWTTGAFAGTVGVVGAYAYQELGVRPLLKDGNEIDYPNLGLPHLDKQPVEADILQLAQDQEKLKAFAEHLSTPREISSVVANTNLKAGHAYIFTSQTFKLTTPGHAVGLGMNIMRLLIATFPNGGKEIPQETFDAIKAGFSSQLQGTTAGSIDLLQQADTSPESLKKWQENGPIDGPVRLGLYSYILVSNHQSFQHGDLLVHVFLADVSSIHPLAGKALHMLAINTKTGEANFGVVGAGQHPVFRGIDGVNNMIVGTLWHTLGESTITFINHYGEQAVQRPDLVAGILYDYQSLKKALDEVMPEKTQKYRKFLERGDDWSGIAIKAENYLLSYSAPSTPPSAEQEAIIEDALDNSQPDEPLVDDEDLQEFSRDDPEEQPTSSTTEDPGTSEPPAIINDPTRTEDPNTIDDPAHTEDPNTIDDPTSTEDPSTLKDPSTIEPPPTHESGEIGHGE